MKPIKNIKKSAKKRSDGYHHGDLRSTLIATALQMLETQSPSSISMRELAKRAGVSQAAPYRHFRDKEVLFAAIAEQAFELKLRFMTEAMAEAQGDPLKTYYACGLAYLRMGLQNPQHFKLMFSESCHPSPDFPGLQQVACATFASVVKMVQQCQSAGLMGPGDPFHRAMNCWTVVHGFTTLYVNGNLEWLGITSENAEAALRTLMSQNLQGVRTGMDQSDFGARLFETVLSKDKRALLEQVVKGAVRS